MACLENISVFIITEETINATLEGFEDRYFMAANQLLPPQCQTLEMFINRKPVLCAAT